MRKVGCAYFFRVRGKQILLVVIYIFIYEYIIGIWIWFFVIMTLAAFSLPLPPHSQRNFHFVINYFVQFLKPNH